MAVSAHRAHLVVAKTLSCRLLCHWLHGPTAGKTEVLANLPWYPDNVRPDKGDQGWVLAWAGLNREKNGE